MYTEDDTFRVLARPDIHKMVVLHQDWQNGEKHKSANGSYSSLKNIEFAKYYGWTWIEFLKAKKIAGYTY